MEGLVYSECFVFYSSIPLRCALSCLWPCLHPAEVFVIRPRGRVSVKGKGSMHLYWLDGYKRNQDIESHSDIYGINTRK